MSYFKDQIRSMCDVDQFVEHFDERCGKCGEWNWARCSAVYGNANNAGWYCSICGQFNMHNVPSRSQPSFVYVTPERKIAHLPPERTSRKKNRRRTDKTLSLSPKMSQQQSAKCERSQSARKALVTHFNQEITDDQIKNLVEEFEQCHTDMKQPPKQDNRKNLVAPMMHGGPSTSQPLWDDCTTRLDTTSGGNIWGGNNVLENSWDGGSTCGKALRCGYVSVDKPSSKQDGQQMVQGGPITSQPLWGDSASRLDSKGGRNTWGSDNVLENPWEGGGTFGKTYGACRNAPNPWLNYPNTNSSDNSAQKCDGDDELNTSNEENLEYEFYVEYKRRAAKGDTKPISVDIL